MWIVTIRSPLGEPAEFVLKPGKSTIGRKSDNDMCIPDESASRVHAELNYDPKSNTVILRDLDSTNGTFVNRERITQPRPLQPDDQVRIGQHIITLSKRDTSPTGQQPDSLSGTQPLTRDLLLESLDQHAVLLYEVAGRLNTIIDLETALREVANLLRVSLGADKCEVILAEKFGQLQDLGFPTSIARLAIDQKSAVVIPDLSAQSDSSISKSALLLRIRSVMCVPILSGEEIAGLIYVYKTRPLARPFDQRDLQLAVAISHQASLTIQRTRLLKRIRQEQRVRQLLQRFLPSSEAEHFLQDYLQTGRLPELQEQTLTVLFADIRDSTGLAERLGAWRFSRILSRYYQEMTEAVFAHNGLLNKYLGDGLMAVFGVTRKQTATPEEQAVLSALEMLNRLDDLNRVEGEKIEIGIGVNTGSTIAGYVGTEERIEFTVLGDTVNVAQRLQEQARPNRVFVGAATRLAINGNYNFRPVGRVELRGRTQPIEAFEVLRV